MVDLLNIVPIRQQIPPAISVCGVPIRWATAPASRLPRGAAPINAIV